MKQEYSKTEDRIINLFEESKEFNYQGNIYKVLNVGKPKISGGGEPKTDVYVLTRNVSSYKEKEFKISVKQDDADFLENKLSLERATQIFGPDVKNRIIEWVNSVKEDFYDDFIISFKKQNKTAKGLKIGWRFDLTKKPKSKTKRSRLLQMTNSQKIDVFSGTTLNDIKKNARVNEVEIKDSGVPNLFLSVKKKDESLDFYIKKLIPIQEFAIKDDIYFAFRAVNYLVEKDKYEKSRYLAVSIKWHLINNKINSQFIMNKPLEIKSNEVGENIKDILRKIKIDSNNFIELKNYVDKDVKYSI